MKTGCLILAAGSSSRLGYPKQLVMHEGKTLIEKSILTVLAADLSDVYVVLGSGFEEIKKAIAHLPVNVIHHEGWQEGMGSSIREGIKFMEAKESCDAILILLCDQPHISPEHLKELTDEFSEQKKHIIATGYAGQTGVPALFGKKYFSALQKLSGDTGAKSIIYENENDVQTIMFEDAATDMDTVKPIVTALASFGMSGRVFHAPFLAMDPGFELRYILERNKTLSKEFYPDAVIVNSYAEFLKQEEIELVVVNTPPRLHYEMVSGALNAGKHVVVEKPFVATVKEGEALLELARAKNKILAVYHNKRIEGDFKTVAKLVREGALGKISYYESHYDRFRPDPNPKKWKEEPGPGSGLLYDLGPHLIDQALALFGMPDKVEADLQIQRPGSQVRDYFKLTLHYPGCRAVLRGGMLVKEPGPKFIIEGDKGKFVKSGSDPQEELLIKGVKPEAPDWGREDRQNWGTLYKNNQAPETVETLAGSYADFFSNLFRTIRFGEPLLIGPEEAMNVMRILELAEESHEQRAVIKV